MQVVILAAGKGKRMYSSTPKVLHLLAGKPLLQHVIETAYVITQDKPPVIVIGHQGEKIREAFADLDIKWVEQQEQLGTGHAIMQAMPILSDNDDVLILYGDVPLLSLPTLQALIACKTKQGLAMVTAYMPNPFGYGRIKRDEKQHVIAIVEEKDATDKERTITEINPGIYLLSANHLKKWLPMLTNNNAQQEYYLTDIIKLAVEDGVTISTVHPENVEEILGINDCEQLAFLERYYQQQMAKKLLQAGVTLRDPARIDIRGDVKIGRDVVLDVNVILAGKIIIGDGCSIGANTILRDVELGNAVEIRSHSIIEGAKIASGCSIGPFARIRPDTLIAQNVNVGNFVEIKKSQIAEGSKVNHLSYVGDTEIGKFVNIGAGTITCNYDGVSKHKTIIRDHVFIGSDTQLIAPVTVGEGATIGAGSTITEDVPAHELTISRVKQFTVKGWKREG